MSFNKPVPEPRVQVSKGHNAIPNYTNLVRFLVEPFLDSPESLKVDCEMSQGNTKVWIRIAFEGVEKGKVYGRGGRNIQAIRTVIEGCAQAAGQSVYLDIYGSSNHGKESTDDDRPDVKKFPPRRSSPPKPPSRFHPR